LIHDKCEKEDKAEGGPGRFYQSVVPGRAAARGGRPLDHCLAAGRPSKRDSRPDRRRGRGGRGGNTVQLSQCPLCGKHFERAKLEVHAASCPGLYSKEDDRGGQVECPVCKQTFAGQEIAEHAQRCGEVMV